jgi:outer membrane protein assembly factor BamA
MKIKYKQHYRIRIPEIQFIRLFIKSIHYKYILLLYPIRHYSHLFLLTAFLVLFFLHSHAQNPGNIHLKIECIDCSDKVKFREKQYFTDTVLLKQELLRVVNLLQKDGYISASIDSVSKKGNDITAFLRRGSEFKWKQMNFQSPEPNILRKSGIRSNEFTNQKMNPEKLHSDQDNIIRYYENNGYPFAQFRLDSITWDQEKITANARINKMQYFSFDSITLKGNVKISSLYIYKYVGIKPGAPYDESIAKAVGARLKEISFLRETRPYEIIFAQDKAKLYLYLDNKKSNYFNGIIGVLPNDKTTGKLLVTGEVDFYLVNAIGHGETVSFDWKKLEKASQDLKAKISYPFLFRLPIGTEIEFLLNKKDTLYLTANSHFGLQFLLQRGNYIKAYFENKQSNLLSTSGLASLSSLPPYADISLNLYGIAYSEEHLDYKFNPRKGYAVKTNIGTGLKKIRKNSKLNPAVYENVKLNSTQTEGTADISCYIPLFKKSTIKLQNKSGYIYNSNLFENELFRIGGLNSLRGVQENSLLASSYSIFTGEYRLLIEQNSCLYAFFDGGYYEKNIITQFVSDFPYGFGAGIDFETKAGIFTISYALGKQFDNPIEIKSSKIHFGYINRF